MSGSAQGTKSDAEFFAERGFGQRIGFGERPALIIIDILTAFTDPAAPLGANLEPQLAAIAPLLAAAHARGRPVIFSSVRYDEADVRDAGIWARKMKGVTSLQADGKGWELDPRLDFRGGDTLLYKKYASCFFGTDLVPKLLANASTPSSLPDARPAAASAPPRSTPARMASAPSWSARPSATVPPRRTRRACSISTPNTPTWSGSTTR